MPWPGSASLLTQGGPRTTIGRMGAERSVSRRTASPPPATATPSRKVGRPPRPSQRATAETSLAPPPPIQRRANIAMPMRRAATPTARCRPIAGKESPAARAATGKTATSASEIQLGMVKETASQAAAARTRAAKTITRAAASSASIETKTSFRPPYAFQQMNGALQRSLKRKKPPASPPGAFIPRWRALGGRAGQGGLDALEGRLQRVADQGQHAHDGDRDQGGDQAILDGGGAGFVLQETGHELRHWALSLDLASRLCGGLKRVACSPLRTRPMSRPALKAA